MLPNTMEREVDWKSMLEERTTKETKLATKSGRNSSENFETGDKVILQETTGRRKQWIDRCKKGTQNFRRWHLSLLHCGP